MLSISLRAFSVGFSTADNLQASLVMSLLFIDERKVGVFIEKNWGFKGSMTSQLHIVFDISLVPVCSFYF